MHSRDNAAVTEPSESELALRASKGDADAFSSLYEQYFDRIYRYVFFKTSHVAEAEDLTERVFLKAWEAMARYRERGGGFRTWLYRIAHNTVIDYHRTKKDTIALQDVSQPLAETAPLPEQVLVKQEEIEQLHAAIAQLPDEQQQILILRFVEGISHSEVAAIVGKSEGACRVVQCRALAALHEILEQGS